MKSFPELGESDAQAGEEGGVEFVFGLAGLVGAVGGAVEDEALEGFGVAVEEPVVGDAGLGVPISFDVAVVTFVARADGFDD